MFKPEIIALDFETAILSGEPSVDFHRNDFRAISAAFSWFSEDGSIKSQYCEGEPAIREMLLQIAEIDVPLVAHNAQFELGVLTTRFPDCKVRLEVDTMRLVQNRDNGTAHREDREWTFEERLAYMQDEWKPEPTGLGLQVSAERHLPIGFHNHKEPFHQLIRERGGQRGREGSHLHLLTRDELHAYNISDSEITLRLFERLTKDFAEIGFDWKFDHFLHISNCRRIVGSKIRGIRVDIPAAQRYLGTVQQELADTARTFRDRFRVEIERIESEKRAYWIGDLKTDAGRKRRADTAEANRSQWEFNPRSTKQLRRLFVDELGITPKFWTKESKQSKGDRRRNPDKKPFEPSPSFRAVHLASYGEGGEILQSLKKRQLVEKQTAALLKLAEYDGRWHVDIRACGTATNRLAGGGGGKVKLNVQGLARRDKGLMSCLVADEGKAFFSIDLASGEPTVTTHFSGDANYYESCFGMVGKAPYYGDNGLLYIDDPYLMLASVSPITKAQMRAAFDAIYDGKTFAEKWLEDKEYLTKKVLHAIRPPNKISFLGLGYGQQPKGMVSSAYDAGFVLHLNDAKALNYSYWNVLFPGLRDLEKKLQIQFKKTGHLVTTFGYRLVPKETRLCFNYWIQAHVSGIIKVLEEKFYAAAPWAEPLVVIHDELVGQIPINQIEPTKRALELATASLNQELKWTVNIRTGFVTGTTLYEAK